MSVLDLIRLLVRRTRILVIVPVVMAGTVFLLTQDQPQTYNAHTTLYTGLASGYEDDDEGGSVDYRAVQSAFDNLIETVEARSTLKTVALQLIAQRVAVPESAAAPLRPNTDEQLQEILPDSLRQSIAGTSASRAERILRAALDRRSVFQEMIFSGDTPFSIPSIRQNLHVRRVDNSDLLEMRYTAADPALCKQVLTLLVQEVKARRQRREQRQMGDVVTFFESQVDSARKHLDTQVAQLRDFGVQNEIINYPEQTKAIAQARQRLARDLLEARTGRRAAQSARDSLASRIDANLAVLRSNENVLRMRRELSDLSAKRALQAVDESATTATQRRIDTLRTRLSDELRRLYRLNHGPSGLTDTRILNQWLERVLAVAEENARVEMLTQRMEAFQQRYRTLAPLGSELSGIKREVDIAKNQYLELLNSLNQARLERRMEKQSALRMVDPPLVPKEPVPSNRLFLVAGSAAAGLVLALAAVVALFLLDGTLRTPAQAEQATGLELAGAYPVRPESPGEDEALALEQMQTVLDAKLLRSLQTQDPSLGRSQEDADVLLVTSTRSAEGKTHVTNRLCAELAAEAHRVHVLVPHADVRRIDQPENVSPEGYDPDQPMSELVSRVDDTSHSADCDLVVVETPALVERALPVGLAKRVSGTLLVIRSVRRWARADADALRSLQAGLNLDPLLVLNGTSLDALDAFVGQVPRQRSFFRRHLKRWLRFEFRSTLPFSS